MKLFFLCFYFTSYKTIMYRDSIQNNKHVHLPINAIFNFQYCLLRYEAIYNIYDILYIYIYKTQYEFAIKRKLATG